MLDPTMKTALITLVSILIGLIGTAILPIGRTYARGPDSTANVFHTSIGIIGQRARHVYQHEHERENATHGEIGLGIWNIRNSGINLSLRHTRKAFGKKDPIEHANGVYLSYEMKSYRYTDRALAPYVEIGYVEGRARYQYQYQDGNSKNKRASYKGPSASIGFRFRARHDKVLSVFLQRQVLRQDQNNYVEDNALGFRFLFALSRI